MERAGEIVDSVLSEHLDLRKQQDVPHPTEENKILFWSGQSGQSSTKPVFLKWPYSSKRNSDRENSGSSGQNAGSSGQNAGSSRQDTGSSGQNADLSGQNAGSSRQDTGSSGQNAGSSGQNAGSSGQNTGSSGQQNERLQSKLQEIPLHDGDRQNSGSSGENSSSKGQNSDSSGQPCKRPQHKFQKLPQASDQQQDSSMNPYAALVDCLRATWLSGKTRPMEYRKTQLEGLSCFLQEHETDILHALSVDMRRPPFEGYIADISMIRNEVNYALNNLCSWMKDEYVDKSLATKLDCAFVRKDPYGVVLIISPFNYPFQLTLVPMVGAIAAGNCVIIKPSEQSSCSEKLMTEVLPTYLDPDTFAVVTGGVEPTTRLLQSKFDYIFFTGSPSVGKIVMKAAAKHVTPLTLELGGQNPCYVDCCCNFQNAANRIVWAKFFNAGQTCLAPDYVICTIETQERLMPCLRQAIREFYGCNPRDSPDFGRMINDKHFQRVRALLDSGRIAIGGETDECDRYIAPTVVVDVKEWDSIMQREVFGPVLPMFVVEDLDEAIQYINSKERPLAVYAFSCDSKVVNRVLDCTSSGGFCGNDCMMHVTLVSLPFGGVGLSGLGKYHGKYTFDTFTHERGCLNRCMGLEAINCIRYPPYTQRKLDLLVSTTEVKRRGFCTLL